MHIVKKICLGNNSPIQIRQNTDLSWETRGFKILLPVFYFLFYISFDINRYQFCNFLEFQHYLIFVQKFCFLTDSLPSSQPHPLNGQNLLNVTFFFANFPSNIFFVKIYKQNHAKHFLKNSTTDSLVFFSKQSSTTAILTQASVVTCKLNF